VATIVLLLLFGERNG